MYLKFRFCRHLLKALLCCFFGGIIFLSSCDDRFEDSSYDRLYFTAYVDTLASGAQSRGGLVSDSLSHIVTALEDGMEKTLYLHTEYTDGIPSFPFDGETENLASTRGIRRSSNTMYDSFGVSAYSYTDSWSESKTPNYFYNATASKSGSNYTLSSTYYWPGASYKMKFFAYAPKDNGNYVLSANTQAGSPTISVTIPDNVDDQKDLLVAKTDEVDGNTNTAVPLTFSHALTAIRFVCGDDMQGGTVKSISLKNVYSKGTYNMETESWSSVNTPATFSQTLNKSTAGTANDPLVTENQTFMMVPQTLPDGAQLEVVFTDNANTDHTLSADIRGQAWPMGKTVTYKISNSSINWTYTLTVSQPADFTYTGSTQQYNVTSYRENTKGIKEAVRWTTLYSTDNGASWTDIQPDWLTAFTVSGSGGEVTHSYNATVGPQIGIDNSSHTTALQNTPTKGSVNIPYNLANQTNGDSDNENTANCYVVNAPGYYSFPLVYGNAIKNSIANASAYTSTASGTNILSPFINHTGNGITDPYINKNANCTPSKAELVWQDAQNLVTDVKYNSTGNGNISFKVDKSTIRQGNAVISIKDASDEVLWSWHIWVTDEDISQTIAVTNHQKVQYNLMSVNLGWCDGSNTIYAERSCKVKFTAGKISQIIIIRQASNSITTGGNHPFYQWGRKDPFLPSNGLSDTNKTWYGKDGSSVTVNPTQENFSDGVNCIKNYILHPNVMQNQWQGDNRYYNLWSADNTTISPNDNLVKKTIYDPCPVGFKLPASNAFTGFTITGVSVSTGSQINGAWNNSKKGWNFYTDSSKGQTIFFPASGWRNYSGGGMSGWGGYGCCWSALPVYPVYGQHLYFNWSNVNPLSDYNRPYGFGVRPSRDL
ncbi:fimbrillin family protein [Bacteroides helcogenes]|uniref:Fimbrillin family protein n=1 Tax=Bacteroides helcogenes (strain ATCC 35417 / DSM 20613 / JCM 6297 / CCUG 15421 / P 36-108) TaxID=693979 RepID=E6SNI6_BACT6|nr:hypothetical protein Bache_1739 [Bacteroides helcogenes P 36-108]